MGLPNWARAELEMGGGRESRKKKIAEAELNGGFHRDCLKSSARVR